MAGVAQIVRHTSVGAGGGILNLSATRGSDADSHTILQNGDGVGTLSFKGSDGAKYLVAASVVAQVDGTPGLNDLPGRLIFGTTADGGTNVTERMRIDSTGSVGIGGAGNVDTQLQLTGTWTTATAIARSIDVLTTLNAAASQNAYGVRVRPTLVEAGSGTHSFFAGIAIEGPAITDGGITTTNAASLYIPSTPTGATNNYAIYSAGSAQSYFAGNVGIGTTAPSAKLEISGGDIALSTTSNTYVGSSLSGLYWDASGTYTPGLRSISGVGILLDSNNDNSDDREFVIGKNSSDPDTATLLFRFSEAGNFYVNDNANANMTQGITINQGAADNEIFTLKSSDVLHASTSLSEEDTWLTIKKLNPSSGSAGILGFSEGALALSLQGSGDTSNIVKTSSGRGTVEVEAFKQAGSPDSDANLLGIRSNGTTKFLFDAEGDFWLAGDIESLGGTEIAINESGADVDFRVESDTNTNAFFVQGSDGNVGIGTTSPQYNLHVVGTSNLGGSATFGGSITPALDDTYDLGSNTLRWRDLYLGPATLHIGTSTADEYALTYDTTNNRLGFNVNDSGTAEIVFDSSGNVGIGTTGPSQKFHVVSSANRTPIAWQSSDSSPATGYLYGDTSSTGIKSEAGSFVGSTVAMIVDTGGFASIYTSGTERLRVNSSGNLGVGTALPAGLLQVGQNGSPPLFVASSTGNVGIGTTGPTALLHVFGGNLRVQDSAGSGFYTQILSGDQNNRLRIEKSGGGRFMEFSMGTIESRSADSAFRAWGDGTGGSDYIYIEHTGASGDGQIVTGAGDLVLSPNSGNVGIGEGTPLATLHVGNSSLGTSDTNELEIARLNGTTGNEDYMRFFLDREGAGSTWTTAVWKMQRRVDATDMGYLEFGDRDDDLITFGEGTTEYMRIDANGNVGIGTSTPGKVLDVKGTAGMRLQTSNTTDLNFASNTPTDWQRIRYDNSTGDLSFQVSGDGNFTGTNDVTALTINWAATAGAGAGRVGINTTTPIAKLNVVGGGTSTGVNLLTQSSAGAFGLAVLDDGNVGIGTTGPGTKLQVAGDITLSGETDNAIIFSPATPGWTSSVYVRNEAAVGSEAFRIFTRGAAPDLIDTLRMGITSAEATADLYFMSSNVGIGTTGPFGKAEIRLDHTNTSFPGGLGSTTTALVLSNTNTTANNYAALRFDGGNNITYGAIAGIFTDHTGGSTDMDMAFATIAAGSLTEKMRILNNGNVGIGTASPGALLDISASGDTIQRITHTATTGTSGVRFFESTTEQGTVQFIGSAHSVTARRNHLEINNFTTAGTPAITFSIGASGPPTDEKMRITSGGNVGIGIATPQGKLQVKQSTDVNLLVHTVTAGSITLSGINDANSANISMEYRGSEHIFTAGNVGIGTVGPGVNLDVVTGTAGSDTIIRSHNTDNTNGASDALLYARVGGSSAGDPLLTFEITDVVAWNMGVDNSESDKFQIGTGISGVSSGELLTIQTDGNVGIGTASPTRKLQVTGNIFASTEITTQTQFFDLTSNAQGGTALCRNGTDGRHSECSSDIRLKTNIANVEGSTLDKIMQLRPVEFDWINGAAPRSASFIAQEVRELFPLTVGGNEETGYLTFTPGNLVPYAIKAIQELDEKVDSQSTLFATSSFTILDEEGDVNIDIVNEAGRLYLKNNNGDATIAFDPQTGNAYFTGTVVAKKIRAESIEGLDLSSLIATASAQNESTPSSTLELQNLASNLEILSSKFLAEASSSSDLSLDTITAVENLTSIGQTLLGNTNIAGTLTVGTMVFDDVDSSINTIDTLKLQDSSLSGAIELFAGKVKLARNGDIETEGTIQAKSVHTEELTIMSPNEATDSAIPATSIGSATIKAGQTSAIINTSKVSSTSKVFLTPTTDTTQPLFVRSKVEGQSFTVEIKQIEEKDITFDWWLINSKPISYVN